MNPRMRDPPPRRAIAKTLVLTTSIFFLQFKLISSGKNSFLCFVKSLLRILSFYRDSLSIPRIGNEQHEAKIQISIKRIATIRRKHH